MPTTLPKSVGLPPVDSYIYMEWQEDQPEGQAILRYRDGALETINVNTIKGYFTQKSSKAFLPITSVPPQHPKK